MARRRKAMDEAMAELPQGPEPRLHAERLLAWYDRHRRVLPWRAPDGKRADPYHVWLSEIMLQQTTVQTVGRYFVAFIERWPTVRDLAAAPLDDVLHQWQGLGYYARARNLHACARAVVERHGGVFPDDEERLRALPGIGAYTSAAIAAIAFDRPASAVDGNVDRVIARLHALDRPIPDMKPEIRALAARLVPPRRAGDYAQAMMDLGATVCVSGDPRCVVCPLMGQCEARRLGIAAELPRKRVRAARPVRRGIAFFLQRKDGAILLRRRPPRGLLGGMMEVPSSEWREGRLDREAALLQAPLDTRWRALPGVVRHVFTHFELELSLVTARLPTERAAAALEGAQWCAVDRLGEMALPTVMKKVLRHAIMAGRAGGTPALPKGGRAMARHARHTTAHPDWRRRFRQSLLLGLSALAIALAIGILGYRFIVGQEWSLALLNASMILSGMGPIGDITGLGARVFASAYALFSGLVFVGVCGVLSAPWVHLFLHRFHADLDDA